jgi:hypothetical protein
MSKYYYDGTIEIDNAEMYVEVKVHAEAHGFWKAGDSFGCGCEPPDEDFEIDEIKYISAKTYDEEGNASDVEITDEIKNIIKSKLCKVEFIEY